MDPNGEFPPPRQSHGASVEAQTPGSNGQVRECAVWSCDCLAHFFSFFFLNAATCLCARVHPLCALHAQHWTRESWGNGRGGGTSTRSMCAPLNVIPQQVYPDGVPLTPKDVPPVNRERPRFRMGSYSFADIEGQKSPRYETLLSAWYRLQLILKKLKSFDAQ
jgi:hypothetical protein